MRKIRIGKDIEIKWTILTNGETTSLLGRDLRLEMYLTVREEPKQIPFTVESGNILKFTIKGTEQENLGKYTLTLWENYKKDGQTILDACNAFELVKTTCDENDELNGLDIETVELSGNIEVGVGGVTTFPDAPFDGQTYGRNNGAWVVVEGSGGITIEDVWEALQGEGKEQISVTHLTTALQGYATQQWVTEKGYLTSDSLAGYATQTWVQQQGYLTAIPSEYVTATELQDYNYATQTQVSQAVSDKLTKTQADGYYQPKGDYALKSELPDTSQFATKDEVSVKADKVSTENVSETTKELQPNRYYIFGEMPSLTITLAEGEEGKLNEYMFEFTSGTTPTTLTLPESVKWMGEHTIEASKTYQVSIVNNIAVIGGAS